MENYNKQQVRNFLATIGLTGSCRYDKNTLIVNEPLDGFKKGHREYLLKHGFTEVSDDILGTWLEYKFV